MSANHPDKQRLIAFGQGFLDPAESVVVEQHLHTCSKCCETLEHMEDDSFVVLIRACQSRIPYPLSDGAIDLTMDKSPQENRQYESSASTIDVFQPASPMRYSVAMPECPLDLLNHPRYQIIAPVGRGGMGCVYKAEHRLMRRSAAIKVINPELVRHPLALERFRREVRAAAKLSHPNIVAAWDAEQAGDLQLLVMEFVDGIDLATLVQQQGPLDVEKACHYIAQAALGLQHAHEKGMVHRDIKPHNLMLTPDGRIRILDFGLAGIISSEDDRPLPESEGSHSSVTDTDRLTSMGILMGTPDYMAPEQAVDACTADIRADIYSLGCTLYFLITARTPFLVEDVAAKLRAHAQDKPESLTTIRKDVPPELSRVTTRMLAKNPNERFQTPAEVVAALAPWTRVDPRKPRIPLGIATAVLSLLLFLSGVIVIATNRGRLEIRSDVKDIKVIVKRDGAQIDVFDLKTGAQMKWLPSGEYEMEVVGNSNDVVLDKTGFTMSRLGQVIVTARWNNRQPVTVDTARPASEQEYRDPEVVAKWLNEPTNTSKDSMPVVLVNWNGKVAVRFANWLIAVEDSVCEPATEILGRFEIPSSREFSDANLVFPAGQGLPSVFIKIKPDGEQYEMSISKYRLRIHNKGKRLEFDDFAYEATNSIQTIRIRRDSTTEIAQKSNDDIEPKMTMGISENLIADPSFENTALTQLPNGWRAWLNDGKEFRCEVVAEGHTGQRCLMITGKGTRGVVFGNDLNADRTKRYALKGWVKFEGDKNARALVKFNYFRGSEFLGVHDLVGATTDQPGWRLFEKTDLLDAYPTADHFYVMCHVEGSGSGWFDDLELIAYDRDKIPIDFDFRHGRHNRLHGPNSLHRWIGTWYTEYAFREFDNASRETKMAMTTTSEQTLSDYFLLSHSKSATTALTDRKPSTPPDVLANAAPLGGDERLQLLTFDQNLGAFRQWIFSSNGNVFEWRGPWNQKKQSLELRMFPDASNLYSTEHFVDDDHIEAKWRLQFVMGQRDAGRWTATRKSIGGKVDVPISKSYAVEPLELSQLSSLAGDWRVRATYKPSVWNPQPREETSRQIRNWILEGRFLMTRAFNEKDELSSIWIATYGTVEKSNRFWFFNADGSSGEWRWTWDEASRGFHLHAIGLPTGLSGTGFSRLVDEDTIEAHSVIKDKNGRVLLDRMLDIRRTK